MKNWKFLALIGLSAVLGSCSGDISETDYCPDDPNKTTPGVCGCGISDEDLNKNGVPDCLEDEKVVLSDSDYASLVESTKPENVDLCPDDTHKMRPGICGCGQNDDIDPETGVAWCLSKDVDLCPDDPNKTNPGVCGCGYEDDDSDNDGVPDCLDFCKSDPNKALPGACGCEVEENVRDSDGDGVIDCLDACPFDPAESKDSQKCRWAIADAAPSCQYYNATSEMHSDSQTRGAICKTTFAEAGLDQSICDVKGNCFCVKRDATHDVDCNLGETSWSQGSGYICAIVENEKGCLDGFSSRARDCSKSMCSLDNGDRMTCGEACVGANGDGSRAWCFEDTVTCSSDKPNACTADGQQCAFGGVEVPGDKAANYKGGCAEGSTVAATCAEAGKACVVDLNGNGLCVEACSEADVDQTTSSCSTDVKGSVTDVYTCVSVGEQHVRLKTSQIQCLEAAGSVSEVANICNEALFENKCDGNVASNCKDGVIEVIDCAAAMPNGSCYSNGIVASCAQAPGSCVETPDRSVCQNIDGHDWRVYCDHGVSTVLPAEMGTLDCTALNMMCIETAYDAYCAECTADDLSRCTGEIPANAIHVCGAWETMCDWACAEGYVMTDDKTGCVEAPVPEPV